jgi:hypothetical protein
MQLAHVIQDLDAPIDRLWKALGDFGAIDKLLAGVPGLTIEKVTLKGQGVGQVRSLTFGGGQSQDEILTALDPAKHTFSYTLPYPNGLGVKDYNATVKMTALAPNRTRIDYDGHGEPTGAIPAEQVKAMLAGVYQALIAGALRMATA